MGDFKQLAAVVLLTISSPVMADAKKPEYEVGYDHGHAYAIATIAYNRHGKTKMPNS